MEDQLISLDENMKVTIVNRKKSYEISKQKLSSIPYFVKLFSDSNCDTTKIELDLDESSFDNIIEFILDGQLSISIESASSMVETCDYLGMDEIKRKYYDCFESNFRIKHLEEFLDFYENHKCLGKINEVKLKSFIGKYFVPISNTRAFQKFPVTLLERLLKMHLGVSSELQIFAAIVRWCKFDKKARKKYLPQLMKFVNFRRMKDAEITTCVSMFKNVESSNLRYGKRPRAYLPEFCQSDCIINRQYNKSLISIYELDEDKINIRRLSSSNLWTKYGQFTRDETMSTSLIEAEHIVDIIYDSGRKGIRVDLISKKFKYLEMFGGDNSYYGQVYKYFVSDIRVVYTYKKIKKSESYRKYDSNAFNIKRLEAISLDDHLVGICYGNSNPDDSYGSSESHGSDESDDGGGLNESHDQYFYCSSVDYRKLSSCDLKGPVQTRSLLLSRLATNPYSEKVLFFLTKRKFCIKEHKVSDGADVLDFSFLKDFIGSDSLDHIELISHDNNMLIVNKETKMIYSYIDDVDIDYDDADYWQFMSKIESPEKMIAIASVFLPFDCEQ
ncbi:LOW QUALITY PROTEIN: uncharacterized protein LOC128387926 [Panonychus citri]|uniref:LOW QUALITY PROTEIN: uncharacterized protein LOC128387926 n=1 Tax=Panonychus citri TaxID=50023 RepID=UPI002307F583|nr:LOW QUALITY PROTEIN: uncharacterized protein LOC128387926 [Panonychus citri]